ncbi:hypothetical protein GRAQ_01207 [Rahnella aquatilis CIP 78.65 = ATCC 33071]|uniref:VENN motif pre-toxin domain-containing protein n=1 Tax=Rahnella aquatilis TaxID=34038 RepID=UPI00030807AE|nr:VENN motif pre-toxin domain-containing protein [Rahnella aquatilis]KFD14257.1 hypothetical protein GRAQ_01207 [Rahnella aquatilis CIP 78.65 = ATCC 33071]
MKAATTDAKGNVNEVENITGHALAGAVVAYLQGGSVSGGAAGAATGELAAQLIAKELYPGVKPENLTNEQKANVSALSTLAAGLAGGVAGNSLLATGTGAVAGKTAVENNAVGCSARTCPTSLGDDIMHGGGMGGGTTGGAAGAGIGAIIAGMFGDDEKHDQPNVGKDLTDADKAELGGTGSGTPGGWGPEDEENARNQEST